MLRSKVLALGLSALGALTLSQVAMGMSEALSSPATVTGKGEFIVKCDLTYPAGKASAYEADPILNRGMPSPHFHIFFGNTELPVLASQAAYSQMTYANLEPAAPDDASTSCGDAADASGMWYPELFYDGAQQTETAGNPIYTRAYYVTAGTETEDLPTGGLPIEMMNGYPNQIGTPMSLSSPSGVAAWMQNTYWDCGESKDQSFVSPRSPWPYSCSIWYKQLAINKTGFIGDGIVAHVNFPTCLKGALNAYKGNNPDGGPLYDPGDTKNNLIFPATENGPCPAGYQSIPQVTIRLHTLIDQPLSGGPGLVNTAVPGGVVWSGLPSCFSTDTQDTNTAANWCTNTAPNSDDILLGFDSTEAQNQAECEVIDLPEACGWYKFHGDYMEMWQHVDRLKLDGPAGDPPKADPLMPDGAYAPTLEDGEEDCLLGAEAHVCGFLPSASSLSGI